MAYIFEDGEPTDLKMTFDIKNYAEVKRTNDIHVDIDLIIEAKEFSYKKWVSIDDVELEDLAKTFKQFIDGQIKEYYVWDHAEYDVEFHFDPKMDEVMLKAWYDYPGTHCSGFFFDLYDEEYRKFYEYLDSVINDYDSADSTDQITSRPCLVGNIIGEHIKGENGELVNGTKHFAAGTKVYLARQQWGDGYENVVVIGKHRGSFRYSEIIMDTKFITNYRFKRVYDPTILKMMSESKYFWWDDEDEKWIISLAEGMNKRNLSLDINAEDVQGPDIAESEDYSPYLDQKYYVVWVKYDDIETFSEYCYVDSSHSIVAGEKVAVERNDRIVRATVTKAAWAKRRELDYPPERMSIEIYRVEGSAFEKRTI